MQIKKLFTGLVLLPVCATLNAANGAAATAVSPYTFIGRVMDSTHTAFDTNRVAKITATAKGSLVARTTTYYRENSRRNYTLQIQMATESAEGYAVKNDPLQIDVEDDTGSVWSGVVIDATAGAPGGVREVDIVLGNDADGDGIDDDLYEMLRSQWEDSEYWAEGEDFDPAKDYDGDGVSTINEALCGTNPYDPEDALKITSFSKGDAAALSFTGINGHAYTIEESSTPSNSSSWTSVNVISVPSDSDPAPYTVYLLPSSSSAMFYRVRAE